MAKDQNKSNAPSAPEGAANAAASETEDQNKSNAPSAPEESDPDTKLNANKLMPDPLESVKKSKPVDGEDLAKELENSELDEKRPLCEVSLRKGKRKLANYRVTRLDGTVELCCTEEVGPGMTYKTAIPLKV